MSFTPVTHLAELVFDAIKVLFICWVLFMLVLLFIVGGLMHLFTKIGCFLYSIPVIHYMSDKCHDIVDYIF
jgi:hypothetical protein